MIGSGMRLRAMMGALAATAGVHIGGAPVSLPRSAGKSTAHELWKSRVKRTMFKPNGGTGSGVAAMKRAAIKKANKRKNPKGSRK